MVTQPRSVHALRGHQLQQEGREWAGAASRGGGMVDKPEGLQGALNSEVPSSSAFPGLAPGPPSFLLLGSRWGVRWPPRGMAGRCLVNHPSSIQACLWIPLIESARRLEPVVDSWAAWHFMVSGSFPRL